MTTSTHPRRHLFIVAGIAALIVAGCGARAPDAQTYTLYRNSVTNAEMRIHVATFDAKEGAGYNRENCQLAAALFHDQDRVTAKFWCENGVYKE